MEIEMDAMEILKHVDHTQLKAVAPWEEIEKLCDEAIRYGTASVCIPPCYVKRVKEVYGDRLTVCTVAGFQCDTGEAGGNGAGIAGRSRGD